MLPSRLVGLENSLQGMKGSKQSQDFIPAYKTSGVTVFPKKGLISSDSKEVGSRFLVREGNIMYF